MIVKNGEILAIDHIAHDNTLSGNGTSAKPVGLSQSTKDLIDSKVKKTDFETYKSSAANQISNINTKITTDESNFNSYKSSAHNEIANFKSSAHNEIARVDASIAAVNAAKVDKTTFTQYQTDVANSFTAVNKRIDDVDAAKVDNTTFDNFKGSANGELTGIKQSITDLDNAKQAKGNYVSASNFNSYKSSAHNEIARVDGRIDATNTNLENNYYDITETYNRTEVDEKFANFGGFKFREPDPEHGNEPKLAPEEVIDPKAIYLTQPAGASQYLQWIWNTEVTPNAWKCIGDTTMDLSDYAKTVDVVQSANNNVQTVKDWADDKFETQQNFKSVIAGYYTKDEVNTELATKADKTEVEQDFVDTSAWANATFATKIDLNNDKSELEGEINNLESKIEQDINNASADIINKIDTTSAYLDDKIEAVIDTLEDDYYTSEQIDARLAASGEYYTKTESDTKYVEKSVFETAINDLSSNKLDKSATAHWDVTEYTEGENIKIVGHEISGKDWSNEIAAAVENKVDESELENYVTKTDFNKLDEEVGLIDDDLDILSGKTVSVIKDSETVKAIRSTEPDGTISYTLSAHDGKQADYLWKPTVNAAGDISWELALTGDTPATANIKGSDGDDGKTPVLSANGTHIEWKYTDESIWNDLGDFKGESGADGKDGKDGINGTSAFVRINPNTNYWEISNDNETWTSTDVFATGPQGEDGDEGEPGFSPTVDAVAITDGEKTGTEITFTYKDAQGQTQTTVYSAWNGINGEGATVHFDGIDGIKITPVDTTHFDVGLSGDYKTAIESISADYAKTTDLNDYLKTSVAETTYQTIAGMNSYLTTENAEQTYLGLTQYASDSATFLVADSITGKVNITDFDTYKTSAHTEFVNTSSWANNKFQEKGNYVTTADILTADSNKLTGIKVGDTDYTIQETNWTTTIQTASAKAYNDATANANELYVTKTSAHNEFVNTSSWANTAFQPKGNYVATADLLTAASNKLTGIKVGNTNYEIPLFGGVTTDTNTITGDGNTNPLGVAWSALSGNTITSALSAGSASYAVALGTTASYSALSDIAGAINDAKFAGVSIAADSSITGNGLSTNKLGLVTSAENALTAVDNKLDKTAIVTATIDNTNYVTAVNVNSTNIPIKDTSFWEVTAATGTTASNNTWQHYISTTNTFNYYKMVIHPNGTSSAQEWANDGIIHIILEA